MAAKQAELVIEAATAGHLEAIIQLLEAAGLPHEDCAQQLEHFIVATIEDSVLACACLEPCGQTGLLRSIVVCEAYRGQGIAQRLLKQLQQRANQLQMQRLYLLTFDAAEYFSRFGFQRIDREHAPAEIQATQQFSSLCPQTAVLMALDAPDQPESHHR